jgi:histidine triad (HIT) family protein
VSEDEHDDVVCRVVRGTLDAAVVLRTDDVVAFLDIHPVFRGHTLVCPVRHVDTLLELGEEQMVPLLSAVQRVARAQSEALGAQGTFVAVNNVVSQSVAHLHVHVVPRTKGDGLRGFFWPRQRYAQGERDAYAVLLREALARQEEPVPGA